MWNFREEIMYYLDNTNEFDKKTFDEKFKIANDLVNYIIDDDDLNNCLYETIKYYVAMYMKRQKDLENIKGVN